MAASHILENIVCLELLRRGYDAHVGKVNSFEVDFVAQDKGGNSILSDRSGSSRRVHTGARTAPVPSDSRSLSKDPSDHG